MKRYKVTTYRIENRKIILSEMIVECRDLVGEIWSKHNVLSYVEL